MKLGIMGHGPIVTTFLEALTYVDGAEAAAIYNRPSSAAEGKALAEKFGIPATYQNFDDFLSDETIDTVYIALPNSLHYEYALHLLKAGKHAIVEKPFTATAAQAEHLIQVAKENQLFLFEGITVCYMPHIAKLKELLPRIGDISLVQCNYSQYSSRYDQLMDGELTNVFDPRFAGGSLMDIDSYNIHFTAELFGEPEFIEYFPRMGVSGVDTSGVAILQYPTFTATCAGAKDSASQSFGMVQGRYGCLTINGPVGFAPSLTLSLRGEEPEIFDLQPCKNRLSYELNAMQKMIESGDYKGCDRQLEHSLLVVRLLEEARQSAGITFACDMESEEEI